jgi:hypothetical protein
MLHISLALDACTLSEFKHYCAASARRGMLCSISRLLDVAQ